jgi:hypothetical protein
MALGFAALTPTYAGCRATLPAQAGGRRWPVEDHEQVLGSIFGEFKGKKKGKSIRKSV